MRLLHTGDWHVGRSIRGRSRMDEFREALDEVVGIAVQEGVDAVLLAGDVYDHRSPAPDADESVFDALVRLHEAGIPVVAIAGNHDSAPRFQALSRLLRPIGVEVVHKVAPPDQGSLVEVPSRDGSEAALVACVPFVPERRFGDAAGLFRATEEWYQSYAEGMGRILAAMAEPFREDRVNVLLAHLFTDGALPGGGEHKVTIGIEYAVAPSRLPATAGYVALGHVHRPQSVRGAPAPTRYAGSLLQLDFGETEQTKSVAVVEAHPGRPAKVREVALSAGRRLVDVEGSLDEVLARGAQLPDAHLRVFVDVEGPVPGLAAQVRDALPNAVDVALRYERIDVDRDAPPLSSLEPRDQFVSYYRREHGVEDPPGELLAAFDEVLEDPDAGGLTVRPLKLHVKGFTAFRDEQVLDFSELDVFAISGPTGSGKSSLLDAMTYALFGRVERVGDRVGQLISQGQPRMAVTLEFEVGTDRYRVTRSTSSKGVSKILLERGVGDGWQQAGEGADRIRDAEPMIRQAVGLTYDGFTRSVLLPQGKFQEFVVGDPVKRRAILTELLGLTLFRRMAERAGAMARDATVQAETTARILEAEYADATPQALAEARAAAREAVSRQKAWAKAGKRVLALFERWVEVGRSAVELRECRVDAAAAADRARSTGEELAALASQGVASDRTVAAAGAAAERAATASQAARTTLAEAERTLGTVEGLTETQGLAHALAQARGARSDRASSSAGLQGRAEALGEALTRAEAVLADRQQSLVERAADRERAEAVLEEARHADLVAAVAQGHGPGDPCPVCGTTLVAAPPKPSLSLETAKARCAKAVRAHELAGTEAASAERAVEGVRRDLESNRAEQERSATDLAGLDTAIHAREAELATVLGRTVPDDPAAEIAARLAELRRLEVAEREAQQTESAAREASLRAGRERDRVLAEMDRLRERLTADRGAVFDRASKLLGGPSDLPASQPRPPGDVEASVEEARVLHGALAALVERLDQVLDERADAEGRLLAEGNAAVEGLLEPAASMEVLARQVQAATTEAATATATLEQRVADLADRVERRARLAEDAAAFASRSRLFKALALELRADRLIAFLQAEALQLLAAAGSDRLSDLTAGRYRLRYRGDEFFVVDLWNGEEERSVRTLSGGETFLASLALALALAEQVRSLSVTDRAGLDSLFLDEGFGTLDPDSLRTVIDAIEQLAGDGRLVGVITHVGDLAQQFPRIEVSKSPRGSRLEFVAG